LLHALHVQIGYAHTLQPIQLENKPSTIKQDRFSWVLNG
jgi:hypothetical protein